MSMSLVGGVVGGIIGLFVGAPQIGFAIGSAIGATFEPNKQVEGPKLNDLKIQSSQTGTIIPIIFAPNGFQVAGNVIFASEKRTVATTESHGKGGGGGTDTTNYTYFQDLAIGLADAETNAYVGIRKIWANGKVIYNNAATADAETRESSKKIGALMKFYSGSKTQMPDPTMEAARGVGRTPAYRGLCYVMLTNFEITEYGGQTPNFQFELIEDGSALANVSTSAYAVPTVERKEMVWTYANPNDPNFSAYPTFASWDDMYLSASAKAVASAYYGGDPATQDIWSRWQATTLGGNGMVFSFGPYNGTGIVYHPVAPAGFPFTVQVRSDPAKIPVYDQNQNYHAVGIRFAPPTTAGYSYELVDDGPSAQTFRMLKKPRITTNWAPRITRDFGVISEPSV